MARLPPPHSDPAVMSAEEPLSLWPGCASACVCVCVSTSCSHSWYTHGRPGRFLLPAATHLSTCQVSDWMSLWELVRSFFFFFATSTGLLTVSCSLSMTVMRCREVDLQFLNQQLGLLYDHMCIPHKLQYHLDPTDTEQVWKTILNLKESRAPD